MDISNLGLNSSSFNFSLGHVGKNSSRSNPNPISIFDFFEISSKLGFGGVEFPYFRFCKNINKDLELIKNDLTIKDLFCILDCAGPLNEDEIKNIIPIAKYLNTDIIRIKVSNILCCDRNSILFAWDDFINETIIKLGKLLPYLEDYQIKLAIENHQDLDSHDLVKIIDKLNSEYIGVNFDIGNAFSTLEFPIDFAKRIGDRIILINLKDYKIKKSRNGFRLIQCPFGHGIVFNSDLLKFINEHLFSLKQILEIGALQSRNIEIEKNGFWKNFRKFSDNEMNNFINFINNNEIGSNKEWKTPWENGLSHEMIVNHELNQVKQSIKNLEY